MDELIALKRDNAELITENAVLRATLTKEQARSKGYESELQAYKEELEAYKTARGDWVTERDQLTANIALLEAENERNQLENAQLAHENTKLERNNQYMSRQRDAIQYKYMGIEIDNQRMREALEQLYGLTHAFDDRNNYAKILADICFNALRGGQ